MNRRGIKAIKKIKKKKTVLGIHWRKHWIHFCTANFTNDCSFIFVSKFHNKKPIELGTSRLKDGIFSKHKKEKSYKLSIVGHHVSLHPREQVMHFRKTNGGRILAVKKFNWFPVIAPFNLLYLYSPPIDNCKHSDKKARFFTPIPYNYEDSIQLKVDIFPRDTKKHFPSKNSVWIFWGYCPDYLVRISFNLIKQRVPALLYWPEDKKLEL